MSNIHKDNMITNVPTNSYINELSDRLDSISNELFGDIDVRYKTLNIEVPPLQKIAKGDWIDLYIATIEIIDEPFISKVKRKLGILKDYQYDKGTTLLFNLGIAMELPIGYESYITPRSSTFKKYGLILTNSIGV